MGERGVGKSSVALQVGGLDAPPLVLNTAQVAKAIADRVRRNTWSQALLDAPALVLDGPQHLSGRALPAKVICELLTARAAASLRTVVCDVGADRSIPALLHCVPPGALVTIALRFPKGRAGRKRFAVRMCGELGLPLVAARGTEDLSPWSYDAVLHELRGVLREREAGAAAP